MIYVKNKGSLCHLVIFDISFVYCFSPRWFYIYLAKVKQNPKKITDRPEEA